MHGYTNRIALLTIAATIMASLTGAADTRIILTDNGASDYEIIRADRCTASVIQGARELQTLIRLVGGVELPVRTTPTPGKHAIVIGAHPLMDAAGINISNLRKDGFIMQVKNADLYLAGNDRDTGNTRDFFTWSPFIESRRAGTYFAVVEFARRFLGVEWYMPGPRGMEWRARSRITVPAKLAIREEPRFIRRMIEGAWKASPGYQDKLVKLGILRRNYYRKDVARECEVWGRHMLLGNNKVVQFQHAWFMFIPAKEPTRWAPAVYGREHPEYFALVDGRRTNYYTSGHCGGQLCISNPEVIRTYAENIIRYAKKTGQKNFSLSQNDGGGQCQCARCTALDGRDPVTGEQVLADRLLGFCNRIAARVVREVPDVRLGVIAYGVTRHPPVVPIAIHPNVYISDVYNMLPNLWHAGKAQRSRIIRDLTTWRRQARHVALSSYYNIYGNWSLPWDTTDVTGEVMKIIARYDSSDGICMNNCRYFGLAPGVDGARLWVLARLLWNPEQSAIDLQKQFFRGAFGPEAGKYIEQYFAAINQSWIRVMQANPMDWTRPNAALECSYPLKVYSPIRNTCRTLLARAVAAAADKNDRIRWRVDRVARGWRFTELTMDAIRYARMARTGAYRGEGLTQAGVWEKAVSAGRARRAMLNDPENYYAIGQCSVDECARQRPLGIVEKIPESIHMRIAVPLVRETFTIDGKLDESAWARLTPTRDFRENNKGTPSRVITRVRACRTSDALVLGYFCGEPHMDKLTCVNQPASIWKGDVAEFYFSATGSRMDFRQFLVNPNSIGKAYFMRGDRGMDANWNPRWEYAAHKDRNHWSVEMKIPLKALGLGAGQLATETPFVNFFRERYTQANENSGWAPTSGGFAQPAKYGRMLFTDQPVHAGKSSKTDNTRVSILENGGFESGKLKPWYWYDQGWGPDKQKGEILDTRAKSGKHCILAEHPGDSRGYYIMTCNVGRLQPGRTYRFDVWVRPEGFDQSPRSGVSLRVLGGGKHGRNSQPVHANSTWQCLSLRYRMPKDANFVNLYIRFRSKKPASVLIDDAGFFLEE